MPRSRFDLARGRADVDESKRQDGMRWAWNGRRQSLRSSKPIMPIESLHALLLLTFLLVWALVGQVAVRERGRR